MTRDYGNFLMKLESFLVSSSYFRDNSPDIKQLDDWYASYGTGVSKMITKYGGMQLIQHFYHGSLPKGTRIQVYCCYFSYISALKSVYAEHNWDDSKFYKQKQYWSDKTNQRALFDQLAKQLNITTLDHWYSAYGTSIYQTVANARARSLINHYGSISKGNNIIFVHILKH